MATVNEMDGTVEKNTVFAQIEPPCTIKSTKTVGADLYIRPKVPFCTNSTATSHQIMATVNKMDGTVEKVPSLHKLNHHVPLNLRKR